MFNKLFVKFLLVSAFVFFIVVALEADQSLNIYIPGNAGWVNAGVSVTVGDSILLTATGLVSGATGVPPMDSPDGNGYGPAGPGYLAPGLERYSLVGKIDNYPPFQVGSSLKIESSQAGVLYLAYNDEFYPDNSGGYTVTSIIKANGTIVSEDISTDTIWNLAGSPYVIEKNIHVLEGARLTIEPGVTVKLKGFALIVYGKIMAIGTAADSIVFTSREANPKPLDWDRILVQGSGSHDSEFKYCKIAYGRVGVSFENTIGKISNCLIEKFERSGIGAGGSTVTIEKNTVRYIDHEGIIVSSGSYLISGNSVYGNAETGIIANSTSATIQNNLIYQNNFYGVLIGWAGNEVKIINNTIDGNGILGAGPFGANINCDNSAPVIKNNIITNSTNNVGAGHGAGIRATQGAAPMISFNDVWNNAGGNYTVYGAGQCTPSAGDISADPLFIDRNKINYHLNDLSPCIRTASAIDAPVTDIDSTRRGNPPDMGAYENIADGDQSLPVELSNFAAKLDNDAIELIWTTASETNNLGFEIYLQRNFSNDFELIDSYRANKALQGKGTVFTPNAYHYVFQDIREDTVFSFLLMQFDQSGQKTEYGPITVATVPVQNKSYAPEVVKLHQNYPNPFNAATIIPFELNQPAKITLAIFDLTGKEITRLADGPYPAGYHQIGMGKMALPSGIYFYKLSTDANSITLSKKLLIIN